MFGLKSKSASTGAPSRPGLFVVVQTIPGADPETEVGKEWTYDEAERIFDGVLRHAPAGTFGAHTGARIRVIAASEWNKARLATALLES